MTTTTADLVIEEDRSASRYGRLAEGARGLRTRAAGPDSARALLIIGGIALPLGLVFIILGWFGASRTVNLFEQVPYAISGGMLGLALVFAGGFCYFAYWLTQLVYATRQDAADTRAILERVEEFMLQTSLQQAAAPSTTEIAPLLSRDQDTPRAGRKPLKASPAGGAYLATATGTMYHRPDCPAVAGREGTRLVDGTEDGLVPCRICEPAD